METCMEGQHDTKRKKRFGDRPDGRKLRTVAPMARVIYFIMKKRSDAQNYFADTIELDAVDEYIRKKHAEGMKTFGLMHLFVAAYIRTVSQRPGINRFVSGQTLYSRDYAEVVMTIKREMRLDAPDTCIKLRFDRNATANDVYEKFNQLITEYRSNPGESDFDKVAKILNYIPRLLLRFLVGVLNFLDYFGLMPKALLEVSPFHGSFIITSMGSLGIQPIYHHLYDFGNLPIFLSYGAKRYAYETDAEGKVRRRAYVDFKVVTDERICDGYYFASAVKLMKQYLKNPSRLDEPPAEVLEDID